MPCLFDLFAPLFYNSAQHHQRARVEAGIVREVDLRLNPEHRVGAVLVDMDVDGFEGIAFVRVEEEAVAPFAEHYWHAGLPLSPTLSPRAGRGRLWSFRRNPSRREHIPASLTAGGILVSRLPGLGLLALVE